MLKKCKKLLLKKLKTMTGKKYLSHAKKQCQLDDVAILFFAVEEFMMLTILIYYINYFMYHYFFFGSTFYNYTVNCRLVTVFFSIVMLLQAS